MNRLHRLCTAFALGVATVIGWHASPVPAAEPVRIGSTLDLGNESGLDAYFYFVLAQSGLDTYAEVRAATDMSELLAATDLLRVGSEDLDDACSAGEILQLDPEVAPAMPDGTPGRDDFIDGTLRPCSVATTLASMVIAYDGDRFAARPPLAIADLFDVERFPGRRALPYDPRFLFEWALVADGVPVAAVYDVLASPDGIMRAIDVVERILPQIDWVENVEQGLQMLAAGDVAMAMATSDRTAMAIFEHGARLGILWDAQLWSTDQWVVPKHTRNAAQANRILRTMLASEWLAEIAHRTFTAPVRRSAFQYIEPEIARLLPTETANFRNALRFDPGFWAGRFDWPLLADHLAERWGGTAAGNSWISSGDPLMAYQDGIGEWYQPTAAANGHEPPVYNVVVTPKLGRVPLVLQADAAASVTFDIGPPAEDSVLPGVPATAIEEMAGDEALDLTVSLDCLVCSTATHQTADIVYDPVDRRSSQVTFTITPTKRAVEDGDGWGQLLLTVDAAGIDLAVIKIPAFVSAGVELPAAGAEHPPVRFEFAETGDDALPDLVIDIGAGGDGFLPVGINAVNPALKAHLIAVAGDHGARRWQFESGVSKSDLDGLVLDAYKTFRTVVEQNERALQDAYARTGTDVALSPGAAGLRFSDADRQQILEALRQQGSRLYTRLFLRGDRRLRAVMLAIDDFAPQPPRPLRVKLRATNVYAPWQLLYGAAAGAADADEFWGFKYELGTLQKVDAAQAPIRTYLPAPRAEDVLVGLWRGADEVAERGRLLREHLQGRMSTEIATVESRDAFLAALSDRAENLKLVLFYGHGSSGTVIATPTAGTLESATAPAAGPTVDVDWTGERFMFSPDDQLVPRHVDDLIPADVLADERNPVFLKSQPVVILDACETGTRGIEAMNNNGFIGALTRAGAGAVVVTEAPVWQNFAFHFGRDLLDRMLDDEPMQRALYDVRRRHLEAWNNPLGLVYSLYGNPALRISRP